MDLRRSELIDVFDLICLFVFFSFVCFQRHWANQTGISVEGQTRMTSVNFGLLPCM
jgi:hypothetical protein